MRTLMAASLGVAVLTFGGVSSVDAGASPAQIPGAPVSGTKIRSKSSSFQVDTFWTQVDTNPDGTPVPPNTTRFGNIHVGNMYAFQYTSERTTQIPGQPRSRETFTETFAFANIADFHCPVGVLPPTGGGHGAAVPDELVQRAATDKSARAELEQAVIETAAPPAGDCVHIGIRQGEADGLVINVAADLSRATAVGFLIMRAGGDPHNGIPGDVVGRPRVDAVWTGTGDIGRGKSSNSYRSTGYSSSDDGKSSDRQAAMSGILGPMGFAPGLSGGAMWVSSNDGTEKFGSGSDDD